MSGRGVLPELGLQFAIISLVAIGGGNAVLPEMHRMVVDVHGWMSSETFAKLYALAQAAPGPNILVVTLIGWFVAGIPGALVTTAAITLPAGALAYAAAQARSRWNQRAWWKDFERAVAPLTVGLVLATGIRMFLPLRRNPRALAFVAATIVAMAALKLPLVWIVAALLPLSFAAVVLARR